MTTAITQEYVSLKLKVVKSAIHIIAEGQVIDFYLDRGKISTLLHDDPHSQGSDPNNFLVCEHQVGEFRYG